MSAFEAVAVGAVVAAAAVYLVWTFARSFAKPKCAGCAAARPKAKVPEC